MADRKRKHAWNNYTKQKSVEGGISGLFITCEGQEKRALAEAYNLIDEILGEPPGHRSRTPSGSEEDVADSIKKACTEARDQKPKARRCRQRPTGVNKCLFVTVKGANVVDLSEKLVGLAQSAPRCRYLQRVLPVEETAEFDLNKLSSMIAKCVSQHLVKKEDASFPRYSMEFKARNNDSLKKDTVLKMLNDAVLAMAPSAKVDLTNPEITIFVQLVRKTLMVGAVRNFYGMRKYNMRPVVTKKGMEGTKTYTVRSVSSGAPYLTENRPARSFVAQVRRPVFVQNQAPRQQHPVQRVVVPPIPPVNQQPQQALRRFVSSPTINSQLRYDLDFADAKRCADKSKGLRHFSTKVCEKVKEKGRTNYNEVADELVNEYFDSQSTIQINDEKHQYDMKNIRRRVYDALNVLLAMNIIQKNKKDIIWVGLPTSTAQEFKRLAEEKEKREERMREKTENLQELVIQLVAYKSLVEKNRERERQEGRPSDNSVLYLPYVIINTEKRAMVDCQVANDKSEFLFNFDQPFEIHDDVEVLKRLGLAHGLERGEMSQEVTNNIKKNLPPSLRDFVDQIMKGQVEIQRDQEKHYSVPTAGPTDTKPASLLPTARPPVVIARAVPGSRYQLVKPMNGHGSVTNTGNGAGSRVPSNVQLIRTQQRRTSIPQYEVAGQVQEEDEEMHEYYEDVYENS